MDDMKHVGESKEEKREDSKILTPGQTHSSILI